MEFKELIKKRRSIRKFSERAVPREIVDRILHETLCPVLKKVYSD